MFILDDEDHVKSGEDSWHEVNVVLPFCVIPSAEDAVCGSKNRAA
jgi:hypothetical protein